MKIAIFGLARSGLSAYRFLKQKTDHEVFLVNQGDPKSWECYKQVKDHPEDHLIDQAGAEDLFACVDQIILSPGIPRYAPVLQKALNSRVQLISEIEFAFRHSDIPVVGITGTNGKTTTTTMIGHALELAGKKVFICGNIGRPYSELLLEQSQYDYAIVELSSFQLESIDTFHPKVSMILNITQNHAERYDGFESYHQAKYNIFKNQTNEDFVLINQGLSTEGIKGEIEQIKPLEGFDYSKSYLVGSHNKMNFYCAYKVLEYLDIDNRDEVFQKFINDFKGVELRLEFITEYNGLKIYNDGKSTNDAATLAAVSSFQDEENLYLILGGQLRSNKLTLNETLKGQKIKKVLAYGEAKDLVKENLSSDFVVETFETIADIFEMIKTTKPNGVLLFSPAFPSFDQYKDYVARGVHFSELAKALG